MENFFRSAHTHALETRWSRVAKEADRTQRPIGIIADNQTRRVLSDAPKTDVSNKTAERYRRAALQMLTDGLTPLQKAATKQHHNFLRAAMKFSMVEAINDARRASEKARKSGDWDGAEKWTRHAFEVGAVLDEMFLQPGHATWQDKAKKLKASGASTPKRSKRYGPSAPSAQSAYVDGLMVSRTLADRHAERLFLLDLFGMRPAEMMNPKGVQLKTMVTNGKTQLVANIQGAKVDATRGFDVRLCGRDMDAFNPAQRAFITLLVDRVKASDGLTIRTTEADYRSLNRFLAKLKPGLSCYSYRHKVASDLKATKIKPAVAAQFMGHASTQSLESYGRRGHGGGGRGYSASTGKPPRSPKTLSRASNIEKHERRKQVRVNGKPNFPNSSPNSASPRSPATHPSRVTMKPKPPG
ncbi:hypothetical protein [Dyella sp. RRB7]|uniref:hypothetical protein n=1 Tax=Dyella sp. RRB7 TaxID=2919502 RepID=UPI001FA98FC5|nr:hypothetical protein [Dyella sp. RRB7]